MRQLDVLRFIVVAVAAACGLAACANDVQDATCTPDAPDITIDEDCPYQNGRGPQVKESACPPVTGEPTKTADFADVFSILTAPTRGNCSAAGCHGDEATASLQIFLPQNDASRFYQTLTSTKGSVGRLYIDPDQPRNSWMQCNVLGTAGGGFPMPKPSGLPSEADAETIINWIRAGAPGP